MKLRSLFTLLLSGVLFVGVFITGIAVFEALQQRAQSEITSKGAMLLASVNAVRTYTEQDITPIVIEQGEKTQAFYPQTIPAYSARRVFDYFQDQPSFAAYMYKEATTDPRNQNNRADTFEENLLGHFHADPELGEMSGYRQTENLRLFYVARPVIVKSEQCLVCHGDPHDTPKKVLDLYGSQNAFYWEMDQVVAIQIIYVPASEVLQTTIRSFVLVMVIFVSVLFAALALVNLLLRHYVLEPVRVLGTLAEKVEADAIQLEDIENSRVTLVASRKDELGQLALVFQKMSSEIYARLKRLREEMRNLRIEIDQAKRQQDVSAVTDTDFFRQLKAKAKEQRQRMVDDEIDNSPPHD